MTCVKAHMLLHDAVIKMPGFAGRLPGQAAQWFPSYLVAFSCPTIWDRLWWHGQTLHGRDRLLAGGPIYDTTTECSSWPTQAWNNTGMGWGVKDRQRWLRYLANFVTCHRKPGLTAIRNTKPHFTSHFNLIPSSQLSDEKLSVGCFKALLLVKFLAQYLGNPKSSQLDKNGQKIAGLATNVNIP